jgi:hypothetical protein
MSAAATEAYGSMARLLTADKPDATDELTPEKAAALLDLLSERMLAAAAEARPASFDLKGCRIWAEWDEETK